MVSPQLINEYTSSAHRLAEALARVKLAGEENQVLWVIWRKTYGWHKKEDAIGLSQFVKATGMTRAHVYRALQKLIGKNIVFVKPGGMSEEGTAFPNIYGFNKDFETWKVAPFWKGVSESEGVSKLGDISEDGEGVSPNLERGGVSESGDHKRNYTKETIQNKCDNVFPEDVPKGEDPETGLEEKDHEPDEHESMFEEFWKIMPARHGMKKGKPLARKAYLGLKTESLTLVNKAARNFANSADVKKGIGIMDPVRFLVAGTGTSKWEPWREWVDVDAPSKPALSSNYIYRGGK